MAHHLVQSRNSEQRGQEGRITKIKTREFEVKKSKTCIIVLCLMVSVSNAASVIYVDAGSPNDPGSGTLNDPFRRIQSAIDTAVNEDTVIIQQGVYKGPGNFDLSPNGKLITIRSADPNNIAVVANTIIDPQGAGRGFYIHNNENKDCIISGLTIRNGSALSEDAHKGGGIFCTGSSPTISNCIIKNGYADASGGGICCSDSNAAIINCTIQNNNSNYYGGGIGCELFSSVIITGCTISGNNANREGGAIDSGVSNSTILNCLIFDNNAPAGGGINCFGSSNSSLINCTIAANSATNRGGAVLCRSNTGQYSTVIKSCILWSNTAVYGGQIDINVNGYISVEYSDIQGGQSDVCDPCGLLIWGSGNISTDPCFASFDTAGDPNLWDFHLKSKDGRWNSAFYKTDFNNNGKIDFTDFSELAEVWMQNSNLPQDLDNSGIVDWQDLELFVLYFPSDIYTRGWTTDSVTSPCLNAGDPNSDWTAEIWPNGKHIDMGAFGGTNQSSKTGNPADLHLDGIVNFNDFVELGRTWGNPASIEDLNKNGIVDLPDLAILAANWLWEI
jgi:hypothetical protein